MILNPLPFSNLLEIFFFFCEFANIYWLGFPREMILFIRFKGNRHRGIQILFFGYFPVFKERGFFLSEGEKKDKWN